MTSVTRNILVIGGNGFIGSAVCRAALSRGMQVTSVSSSGRPYMTPKGHSPAWTSKVTWLKGDALNPETLGSALSSADGVVHTLGTLLEDEGYKKAVQDGNMLGLAKALVSGDANPLKRVTTDRNGSYNRLNRDSALGVCEAFVGAHSKSTWSPRPFIYISAEDIFRPIVSARYIESKREAEAGIKAIVASHQPEFRDVYMRPSLVYHAHYRPLTTPLAVLLDLSAQIHAKVPKSIPTPSDVLRRLGLESVPNALTLPPIHVDHVGEAVCVALENEKVVGVVGVRQMRELTGWVEPTEGSSLEYWQSSMRKT